MIAEWSESDDRQPLQSLQLNLRRHRRSLSDDWQAWHVHHSEQRCDYDGGDKDDDGGDKDDDGDGDDEDHDEDKMKVKFCYFHAFQSRVN